MQSSLYIIPPDDECIFMYKIIKYTSGSCVGDGIVIIGCDVHLTELCGIVWCVDIICILPHYSNSQSLFVFGVKGVMIVMVGHGYMIDARVY